MFFRVLRVAMKGSTNFQSSFKALYWLSMPFGLSPYCYKNGKYRLTVLGVVYSVSLIIHFVAVYFLNTFSYTSKYFDYTAVYSTGVPLFIGITCSYATVIIALINRLRCTRHGECDILNAVQLLDRKLFPNVNELYLKHKRYLMLAVVIVYFSYFVDVYIYVLIWEKDVVLFVLLGSPAEIISNLILLHFLHWVTIFKVRFREVNENLSLCLTYSTTKLTSTRNLLRLAECYFDVNGFKPKLKEKHKFPDFRILRKSHEVLVKSSEHINSVYSVPNVFNLAEITLSSVLTLYFTLLQWKSDEKEQLVSTILMIFTLLRAIVKFGAFCYICEDTSFEANRTGRIVHELRTNVHTLMMDDQVQLKIFSQQLRYTKLNFTACGFFTINARLISAIVTIIVTYSIILIQFGT